MRPQMKLNQDAIETWWPTQHEQRISATSVSPVKTAELNAYETIERMVYNCIRRVRTYSLTYTLLNDLHYTQTSVYVIVAVVIALKLQLPFLAETNSLLRR